MRTLGIPLSPSGQFNTEFEYRFDQVSQLLASIEASVITPIDDEMTYQFCWLAIVSFCLPITRFTDSQCHALMVKSRQALLPIMGFNHHTALENIHGPTLYGGKQFKHIATLQTYQHITFFMGHY